eukprot:1266832-Alexandrium_andersonii.AAC.1
MANSPRDSDPRSSTRALLRMLRSVRRSFLPRAPRGCAQATSSFAGRLEFQLSSPATRTGIAHVN